MGTGLSHTLDEEFRAGPKNTEIASSSPIIKVTPKIIELCEEIDVEDIDLSEISKAGQNVVYEFYKRYSCFPTAKGEPTYL